MTSHELPPEDPRAGVTASRCPSCGHRLDAASHPRDENVRPRPGDLSVCIQCAELLRFTEGMAVVRLSAQELAALEQEDPEAVAELWTMAQTILAYRNPKQS